MEQPPSIHIRSTGGRRPPSPPLVNLAGIGSAALSIKGSVKKFSQIGLQTPR